MPAAVPSRVLVARAREKIRDQWARIEEIKQVNQARMLEAFRDARVSEHHLGGSTGYGYGDAGRDVLEEVYARVFEAEAALVRPQIASGTHAITACLFGVLRPGDTLLSISGPPYDTLRKVIGPEGACAPSDSGSLAAFGIGYKEVPLDRDGGLDLEGIKRAVGNPDVRMVLLQRSRGYSLRPAIGISQISEAAKLVKSHAPQAVFFVDNCYGEFVETLEPPAVGVDLIAGSLIKNPGGALAPGGGYIAGRSRLVEMAAGRVIAPGIGRGVGPTLGLVRPLLHGVFTAPHVVGEALLGAVIAAAVFEDLGFEVAPRYDDPRADVIQVIVLGSQERVLAFCTGIQRASPVDSHVNPRPGPVPGYEDLVVMAAGCFIQGSSIELSADAPLRPPFAVYLQGGVCKEHVELGIISVVDELAAGNLI